MSEIPKSKEEVELEKLVFGDVATFENGLNFSESEASESDGEDDFAEPDLDKVSSDQLFVVDVGDEDGQADQNSDMETSSEESESDDEQKAWTDSDDEKIAVTLSANRVKKLRRTEAETQLDGKTYERRLRAHFEKLHPTPKWATQTVNTNDDSDDDMNVDDDELEVVSNPLRDLLNQKSTYISKRSHRLLAPGTLDIARVQDVNKQRPSKSAIRSLEFNPIHPLVLTGGFDRTLRIYHADGKVNPVATSLHIRDSPIQTALFHPDGTRVFAGGRRKYMYIWDIQTGSIEKINRMYGHQQTQTSMERFVISPDGKYLGLFGNNGWMNVLSAHNGQWITGAKVEGKIAGIVWNKDETVTIAASSGDIWNWDVRARGFSQRWRDVSGTGITSIAQTDRWTAVGSSSGIVNIYDRTNVRVGIKGSDLEPDPLQPNFVIDNLVTSISNLEFNSDGQILALSSPNLRDALRLVHVPSFTVFSNWPTSSTPLGRVTSLAFSPNSQMFAVGNEAGAARLWRLNAYD